MSTSKPLSPLASAQVSATSKKWKTLLEFSEENTHFYHLKSPPKYVSRKAQSGATSVGHSQATSMASIGTGKRDLKLDSYTIRDAHKVVRAGDSVLMRSPESGNDPYVGRVEKIEADSHNDIKARVRWYYQPEESKGGRRKFHGSKELFLSDRFDVQSPHTIENKCTFHSFKNYCQLNDVEPEDYYCRFEYKAVAGGFLPAGVAVYCKCELPYNLDHLMVQCVACKD